ncbi:hypothetical protein BGZ83_005691 [Gryganskiella cystojenkinii]|nr:hypothetical protein BGZ83_005691 [Gryganskiella cystojenkinii]
MSSPRDSSLDQQDTAESDAAASFAHSLSVAPLDSTGANDNSVDVLMSDVTDAVRDHTAAMEQQHLQNHHEHNHHQQQDLHQLQSQHMQQPERMAVAELLVSLAQNPRGEDEPVQNGQAPAPVYMDMDTSTASQPAKQQSPIYRNAVDYVGSVKKAYENNPKVYTEFLSALELYHGLSLPIDQLVRTVMTLFQDQPELLLGFKEFLPEAQGLLNQLVPPMMYSEYKGNTVVAAPTTLSTGAGTEQHQQQQDSSNINEILTNGHAAADYLSLVKERSQVEPDMYQHLITLLRKYQKDHSYSNLYFYVSIILRYHPHLLQRFHSFLPMVTSGIEVTEPRVISKAPPEELVVSPDFIEAKDFVQTVKYAAKSDMSMYDRFIFALEKYQRNGWTIDQVYSEVSLIFWNHPDALDGFKRFISTVPEPDAQ